MNQFQFQFILTLLLDWPIIFIGLKILPFKDGYSTELLFIQQVFVSVFSLNNNTINTINN